VIAYVDKTFLVCDRVFGYSSIVLLEVYILPVRVYLAKLGCSLLPSINNGEKLKTTVLIKLGQLGLSFESASLSSSG
jgi:hypothetical protein